MKIEQPVNAVRRFIARKDTRNQFWKIIRNNRVAIKGLLILLLLGFMVPFADAKLGVFSPKLEYVETKSEEQYSVVGTAKDYRVLTHYDVSYFIASPGIMLIRNIVMPNPSNYSNADCGSSYCTYSYTSYSSTMLGAGIIYSEVGDGGTLTSIKDSKGRISAFTLSISPAATNETFLVTMSYQDVISSTPIVSSYGPNTPGFNGSLQKSINITIHNSLPHPLLVQNIAVLQPTQVLNATCLENSVKTNCLQVSSAGVWLWLPDPIMPGATVDLEIVVDFR